MSAKVWEFMFLLKGVPAAKTETVVGDQFIVRGLNPAEWESEARIRVPVGDENNRLLVVREREELLTRYLSLYCAFMDRLSVKGPDCVYSGLAITLAGTPIGKSPHLRVSLRSEAGPDTICACEGELRRAATILWVLENPRNKSRFRYIQLASQFLRYARLADRYEDQLLDYMIALEALYNNQPQDIRYRLALRAAYVLAAGRHFQRRGVYNDISSLYSKRNDAVHGIREVVVTYEELRSLDLYVVESIKRLLCLGKPKDEVLNLVDEAILDTTQVQQFEQAIEAGLEAWKAWLNSNPSAPFPFHAQS